MADGSGDSRLVSSARLLDFNWRVDMKMAASESSSRDVQPTCILQLKVEEGRTHVSEEPSVSMVTFQLTKDGVDSMLNRLGRIQEQLDTVAAHA